MGLCRVGVRQVQCLLQQLVKAGKGVKAEKNITCEAEENITCFALRIWKIEDHKTHWTLDQLAGPGFCRIHRPLYISACSVYSWLVQSLFVFYTRNLNSGFNYTKNAQKRTKMHSCAILFRGGICLWHNKVVGCGRVSGKAPH